MEYNTQRPKMEIPEYGRITQKLAEHLLTIKDRDQRNAAANALINIMSNSTPQFRNIEEYKMKLWDHLHIMTQYKLDVDSPYPMPEPPSEKDLRVAPLAYPKNKIKYRNYGKNLERLLEKIKDDVTDPEKKKSAAETVAYYMKLVHLQWNDNQHVSDDVIKNDLDIISGGQLQIGDDFNLDNIKGAPLKEKTGREKSFRKKGFVKPARSGGGGNQKHQQFRRKR